MLAPFKKTLMRKSLTVLIAIFTISCSSPSDQKSIKSKSEYIKDNTRERIIPTEIYYGNITKKEPVLINAGYGCSPTEYSFIAKNLSKKGFLVITIQHELQTDKYLPSGENIYELRLPNWKQGTKNIETVLNYIKTEFPNQNLDKLNLIGHSNGGDISMLYATDNPKRVKSVISLDNRRMPIPINEKIKILSIRADQFMADKGVIPNNSDLNKYNIKIVTLKNVNHDYLRDNATKKTKDIILGEINKLYQ